MNNNQTAEQAVEATSDKLGATLRARVGLLTPDELASMLGVKVRTLAVWRSKSIGPDFCATDGRSRVLYRLKDIEEWMSLNLVQTDRSAA